MSTNVLLADDHPIIRRGIKNLIDDTEDLVVADEAADGDSVLTKIRERNWGLLVLGLSMPGGNGIELISMAKAERPELPILIFSGQQEERYAVRAMRSGASGYLTKDSDLELLVHAMRKVAAGGTFVSQKTAKLLIADYAKPADQLPHTQLSKREYEVFTRIIEGNCMTDIASDLGLSIKTVSTHKQHILKKLNVSSQVDLVRYAIQHKLLDP
jgi:DNA-binding NarL/FixJ family response regulator